MKISRINNRGNLEVLKRISPNEPEEFVQQRCIFQDVLCGVYCPAFNIYEESEHVYLKCIYEMFCLCE